MLQFSALETVKTRKPHELSETVKRRYARS